MNTYLNFLTFLVPITIPPAPTLSSFLRLLPEIPFALPSVMHTSSTAHFHRVHVILVYCFLLPRFLDTTAAVVYSVKVYRLVLFLAVVQSVEGFFFLYCLFQLLCGGFGEGFRC